jgi:hypothetical protein
MAIPNRQGKTGPSKNNYTNYGGVYSRILVKALPTRRPESGDVVHFGYPKSINEKRPYFLLIHDDGAYWTGITLNWITPKDLMRLSQQLHISLRTKEFTETIRDSNHYDLYHSEIKKWIIANNIRAWRQYIKSDIVSPTVYYFDRNAIDRYL